MALLEIDDLFLKDSRVDYLANISGEVKYSVRGRILDLWHECIKKTSPVKTADEIDILCGWFNPERGNYADLLVQARFARKLEDGSYEIRGVKDRMAWLEEYRKNAAIGGKARAKAAKRDKNGHFISSDSQPEAGENSSDTSEVQPSATVPCSLFPVSVSATKTNLKTKEENFVKIETQNPVEGITEAVDIWKQTLKTFGKLRELNPSEQTQIARAIQRYGYDYVSRALLGAKNEPKSEKYNPKDHVSLQRTLDPQKIEKFVNWGTAAFNSQKNEKIKINQADEVEFSYEELQENVQRVQQLIARIGK